ncbi:DMT family transporter [Fodinicurvata sediminis]|uniref:DMT family transporter n=1 Tax=Fodinicurvata sediminis TaxID=1121832 RepID=UPI00058AD7D6|nr:DMT family transporter [Fodinicurvata sediminis]
MKLQAFSTLPLIIAFVLLWNTGFIAAEVGLPYAETFTLFFWRYAALTLLLLLVLKFRGASLSLPPGQAALTGLVGILSHGVWLSFVLLAIAQGVQAGIVALVVALQPMMTGALSGAVTGEVTSPRQWGGLAIGFAGVVIAVMARLQGGEVPLIGYLLPFVSVVAITAASLIKRRQVMAQSPPPLDLELFWQSLGTMIALLIPAVLLEGLETDWTLPLLGTLAWMVVAVSLAAYALMWILIERMDATRVSSLFYFGPPVTMAMAWMVFGDQILLSDLAGFAVVLAGVALVNLPMRRRSVWSGQAQAWSQG